MKNDRLKRYMNALLSSQSIIREKPLTKNIENAFKRKGTLIDLKLKK